MGSVQFYSKAQVDAKVPDSSAANVGDVLTIGSGGVHEWAAGGGGGDTPDFIFPDKVDINLTIGSTGSQGNKNCFAISQYIRMNYTYHSSNTHGTYDYKISGQPRINTGTKNGYSCLVSITNQTDIKNILDSITVPSDFTGVLDIMIGVGEQLTTSSINNISITNGVKTYPASLNADTFSDSTGTKDFRTVFIVPYRMYRTA